MTADQPRHDREAFIAEAESRTAAASRRSAGIDAQLARAVQAGPESTRAQELIRASDLALKAHTHEAYSVYLLRLGRNADAAQCQAAAAEASQDASSRAADPEPEEEAEAGA
jgi:hypothetical protein